MNCHNKELRLTIRLALILPIVLAISGVLRAAADCVQPPTSQPVPCGVVDSPINNTTGIQGAINVTGWTISQFTVNKVTVYREPNPGEPTQPNGLVLICDAPI